MSRVGEVRDWVVDAGEGPVTYKPQPVMRLSSILMSHQAVQAGRGAAVLPWSLVDQEVASGRLARWGRVLNRPIKVWVLHASSRLSSRKVTSFLAFHAAQFPDGKLLIFSKS